MRNTVFQQYVQEILSFADDENDVVLNGNRIIFERFGQIIEIELVERDDKVLVNYNGHEVPYKTFLSKELAHLDVMASRIKQKYLIENEIYVDAKALMLKGDNYNEGEALKLLIDECRETQDFATKICFVTADAGHGKTILLKKMQYEMAKDYLEGKSNSLFWHIDLHGRDLLRLNEAMMYEIGVLRLSGIYYSSIVTLIRNGLIVLAIDGFDELAAEIGGEKVLSSLSNLVTELDGLGTIIAASRRTFFNTQDYLIRSRLLQSNISLGCEFNELKLYNWGKEQCVQYLSYYFDKGKAIDEYDKMSSVLRNTKNHPILERPFLFTKMVSYAQNYDPQMLPSEFLKAGGDEFESLNKVIEAFLKREVQKWNYYDKQSGQPYLTFEQHIELLSEIAQEMWRSQKDYVSVETIQYITSFLMDTWSKDISLRTQIIRMVESHAFMVIAEVGDKYRRFDHEEFKDYFIAQYLKRLLKRALDSKDFTPVRSFLYLSQMQESVARYLFMMLDIEERLPIVNGLLQMKSEVWKPTYLQPNVGIILPYMLNDCSSNSRIVVDCNLTFSSLIFENKTLRNIEFKGCNFINISFRNTKLTDIVFSNCTFSDIRFFTESSNIFINVSIDDASVINMVTKIDETRNESYSEYSPNNINSFLWKRGINRNNQKEQQTISVQNSEFKKTVRRFLNKFVKSSIQYEVNFQGDQEYYSFNHKLLSEEIIPLLLKYDIIEEVHNKNTIQRSSRAWALKKYSISEIYKAEEDSDSSLYMFWKEVGEH